MEDRRLLELLPDFPAPGPSASEPSVAPPPPVWPRRGRWYEGDSGTRRETGAGSWCCWTFVMSSCCPRQGLRVHYPSQTAAPSRDFPDFLLRVPAAGAARPESGSTTEVSDSEDEDAAAGGPADREAGEPGHPGLQLQEAPPSSECEQRGGGATVVGRRLTDVVCSQTPDQLLREHLRISSPRWVHLHHRPDQLLRERLRIGSPRWVHLHHTPDHSRRPVR